MQINWPTTFKFSERDLDTHFIGQWIVHHIDDYGTVKAGSVSRNAVVRSIVDFDKGIIKLVAVLPDRYGVTDIIMDGSAGFVSKITERTSSNEKNVLCLVDFLYIKLLTAEDVIKNVQTTSDGYKVWKTVAEFDDIVFNQDKTYSYPLYYFGKGKNLRLVGMYTEIPLAHFNHYVRMRDLWYRDYQGSKAVHDK